MKILVFTGGLGNQIFGYAFYKYLKEKFPNEKIFGVYNGRKMSEHNGLEIDKWFDVELPKSRWYASMICYVLYGLKRCFGFTKWLDLSQEEMKDDNALVYWAFHLDKKYIPKKKWIEFSANMNDLSDENKSILEKISTTESCFIHVRRGDYLSERYKGVFEGTCPIAYYQKSIEYVLKAYPNTHFFIFSNDITWCRENFNLNNVTYVTCNTGINSPLDMLLMSHCRNAIIANSTFSYWGAYLGCCKSIVCCPEQWYSKQYSNPELYPKNWISF